MIDQREPGAYPVPNPVTLQIPERAPRAVTSPVPALSPPRSLLCHLPSPQSRPQSLPWLWGGFGQSSFLHPEIRRVRGTGFGSRTWHSCHSGAYRGHTGRISSCQQPLNTHLGACCSSGWCRDPKSHFLLNPGCAGRSGTALGPTHPQFLLGQHSTSLSPA